MQFVNLIKAYVLRHSAAAMELGRYDLAYAISVKKLSDMQQKQARLLRRLDYVKSKITSGSVLSWFYKKEMNYRSNQLFKLENKFAQLESKYRKRALTAQSLLEATKGERIIVRDVHVMNGLRAGIGTPKYIYAQDCLLEARKLLNQRSELPLYGQTLDSTAQMASHVMLNLEICANAHYCVTMAQADTNITSSQNHDANELRKIAVNKIRKHLASMGNLASNVSTLTSKSNRDFSQESRLLRSMVTSLEQFQFLYVNANAKDVSSISQELLAYVNRDQTTSLSMQRPNVLYINMLPLDIKDLITANIKYIKTIANRLSEKSMRPIRSTQPASTTITTQELEELRRNYKHYIR